MTVPGRSRGSDKPKLSSYYPRVNDLTSSGGTMETHPLPCRATANGLPAGSAPPTAWEITEFRGRAGLGQLEADWRRLYAATRRRTSYLSFESSISYVENIMKAPDQLRCLRLGDGQQARAICLLEPQLERRLGRPVRVWGMLHYNDHVRAVLCPDSEARRALASALVAHLRRHPWGRPVLVLGPEPEDSPLWEGMRGEYCDDPQGKVGELDCRESFEKLMAGIPKHFRRMLANARNRLALLPEIRFVIAREPAELAAEYQAFLELEAAGWKGESGSAIRFRHGQQAFYADLCNNLRNETDFFEITALYADGRCLASTLGTRTGSTYSPIKICYDQAYGRVSPGHLLIAKVIERCSADPGIERVDFVSDAQWLRDWNLESVPIKQTFIAIDRWRGPAIISLLQFRLGPLRRFAHWLRQGTGRVAGGAQGATVAKA